MVMVYPLHFLLQTTRPRVALIIRLENLGAFRSLGQPRLCANGRGNMTALINATNLSEVIACVVQKEFEPLHDPRELRFGGLNRGMERTRTAERRLGCERVQPPDGYGNFQTCQ